MDTVRKPQDQPIIGLDSRAQPKNANQPFDQPSTEARGEQGDLEIEFEIEIPEEGGES